MLPRNIAFAACLLFALAACKQAPDAEPANDNPDAPVREIETLPPDETVPPANAAENGADAAEAAGPIPPAFRARWGITPADCTSTRGDDKGLLTIGPDTLRFYESRAKLTRVIGNWPEKLKAEFAFTGEGQSWTKVETLSLTGSSNVLIRQEEGAEFRYRRCGA